MSKELLQQVRLIDPNTSTDRRVDVLVVDGKIAAIEEKLVDIPADVQVQHCAGLVLGPGLMDLYSHSGEPGFEARETLDSLRQAALAGGFTRLTLLPDTHPPLDNRASVEWMQSQSSRYAPMAQLPNDQSTQYHAVLPKLNYWGALTLGTQGEQMVELMELAEAGVIGFTDGKPIANTSLLRRLLDYGQVLQKPIALYCCDRSLAGGGVVRDGLEAVRLGLPGSPVIAETVPLAAVLECVAEVGTPVHLMRISTARGVERLRAAKAEGLPVTASTTWMHLLLNVTSVHAYDPSLCLDPPLGNPSDQAALIQGLQDGTIDAIAIDHTPLTYEEKTVAFAEAPPGAIGLELALPLLWQTFVASNRWSAVALWQSLSTKPAKCLHQPTPQLQLNQPTDLILFDPNLVWTPTPTTLKSRSANTPWLGHEIQGRVIKIWG
jgi:dihydroorotase